MRVIHHDARMLIMKLMILVLISMLIIVVIIVLMIIFMIVIMLLMMMMMTSIFMRELQDHHCYTYIYRLSIGDSRAVLCRRDGKALGLSTDHKPQLRTESDRIARAGDNYMV